MLEPLRSSTHAARRQCPPERLSAHGQALMSEPSEASIPVARR
jgi:hypothetical protein